jgi:hypothetical protein
VVEEHDARAIIAVPPSTRRQSAAPLGRLNMATEVIPNVSRVAAAPITARLYGRVGDPQAPGELD